MSTPSSHTLELRNELSELERMSVWIHLSCKRMAVPDQVLADLDLCAAEAVQNIIAYAYEDTAGHRIHLRLTRKEAEVGLEIEDDGAPFDPLDYPAPPSVTRLEHAALGGRGIFLVRKLMTECRYRRQDGKNILTLARTWQPG